MFRLRRKFEIKNLKYSLSFQLLQAVCRSFPHITLIINDIQHLQFSSDILVQFSLSTCIMLAFQDTELTAPELYLCLHFALFKLETHIINTSNGAAIKRYNINIFNKGG